MRKIGLKVFSSNSGYYHDILSYIGQGAIDFIELYALPGTLNKTLPLWQKIRFPFVIHAAHHSDGMNLSDPSSFEHNRSLIHEAVSFASALHAKKIIVHPGVNGTLDETIRQLSILTSEQDRFKWLVENKPMFGNGPDLACVGHSPDEIRRILSYTSCGFCLDFGHALNTANSMGLDVFNLLDQFLSLNPELFHLCDGDISSQFDEHYHLGKGTFPLQAIITRLPPDASVTLETEKDSEQNLDDFQADIDTFRSLEN
jgi:sugar phosphate isomerase/epimerase